MMTCILSWSKFSLHRYVCSGMKKKCLQLWMINSCWHPYWMTQLV